MGAISPLLKVLIAQSLNFSYNIYIESVRGFINENHQKGFYLEVTTWENDYDHVKTEEFRFDSLQGYKIALAAIVAMSELTTNNAVRYKEVAKMTIKLAESISSELADSVIDSDYLLELIVDMVGTQYESDYYRVVDSYSSYFVDRDVVFPTITIVK